MENERNSGINIFYTVYVYQIKVIKFEKYNIALIMCFDLIFY